MKIGTVINGFEIRRARESAELKGTLYEMKHLRTGAELVFLDNKEENKLFSVAFRTLPEDDTGVFHILEHSVLSGSENYPVKEPFLDLVKSSMNTFLNALTFPDKTMYPVSSRNEKDFLNLTGVYLDAVFKPLIYHNEGIFRQEGWHYEFDGERPFFNGVVYNEMKGALSSVDGQIDRMLTKHLFPDTFYGFDAGGDPASIPDLSYEQFLDAHRSFYSAPNARFYLDGAVPLETVLGMIDGCLADPDGTEKVHEIAMQAPAPAKEVCEVYRIGEEESAEEKTQIVLGKIFASWDQRERIGEYKLLASYLAGSNESPLKRAVLDSGLAQDLEFVVTDGIAQPFYAVVFRNTDPEKKEQLCALYRETLEQILEKGIDYDEFEACLNQFEFSVRETEEPAGLSRNIGALGAWLYGGDPVLYLENRPVLRALREGMKGDLYPDLIRELLDPASLLTLVLAPSKTKGAEDAAAEEKRAAERYGALDEKEKDEVSRVLGAMRAWQDEPDSEEAAATLPVLSLKDVSDKPMWLATEEREAGGVPVLFHTLNTNGIVHVNLFFDISDVKKEDLSKVSFLSDLLGTLPTKEKSASELQRAVKKKIGALDFNVSAAPDRGDPARCRVYFAAHFSALEGNLPEAAALVREILLESDFTAKEIIKENALQTIEDLRQSVMGSGNAFASRRVLSRVSAAVFAQEESGGIDFLRFLEDLAEDFDEKAEEYAAFLAGSAARFFVSSRLTMGETAERFFGDEIRMDLPEGEDPGAWFSIEPKGPGKEAVLIPSGVSYAAYGMNIRSLGREYEGAMRVMSLLLTFNYLWGEIRVRGGAYGCGFRIGRGGGAVFSSFRDPNPIRSLGVYRNAGDYLRAFAESGADTERFIISAIAAGEGLMSTSRQGFEAEMLYLDGYRYEDAERIRREMMAFGPDDLRRLSPLFDEMKEESSVCVVGNRDALGELDESWSVRTLG